MMTERATPADEPDDAARLLTHDPHTGLPNRWADAGMSRDVGAPEALGFTGDLDFVPGDGVVDEAFGQGD